ncbi:hypothetical protein ACOMHN_065831 [Nucella lapillus]
MIPMHTSTLAHAIPTTAHKKAILFLRERRLCSLPSDFQIRCKEITDFLIQRGYPRELIQTSVLRVITLPRTHALQYKPRTTTDRVPFIITHNPSNPPLRAWLREHQRLLHTSSKLQSAVPDVPVVGERNCRSLSSILMPSTRPSSTPDLQPGSYRCQKSCVTCRDHLVTTTQFQSSNTKETFTIRDPMTCITTSNIIYLLSCRKCDHSQYVGEAKNALKTRFYLHRSHIVQNIGTRVTIHSMKCSAFL